MKRLILTLSLLLVLAGPAAGSTAQHPLADQTAQWLTQVLGVPVPTQAVGHHEHEASSRWVAASYPAGDARYILAKRHLLHEWDRPGHRDFDPDAGRILIHELLHGLSMDEGAVDALALDLLPAWSKRFTRARVNGSYTHDLGNAGYPTLVRNVRGLSAQQTGKPWRSRDALLWRRAWLVREAG